MSHHVTATGAVGAILAVAGAGVSSYYYILGSASPVGRVIPILGIMYTIVQFLLFIAASIAGCTPVRSFRILWYIGMLTIGLIFLDIIIFFVAIGMSQSCDDEVADACATLSIVAIGVALQVGVLVALAYLCYKVREAQLPRGPLTPWRQVLFPIEMDVPEAY